MTPKNLKIIGITFAVLLGLFLVIGLPILLSQQNNTVVTTTPKAVDCEDCASEFKEKGGCNAMLEGKDLAPYIPAGCGSCDEAAMRICAETNTQETTPESVICKDCGRKFKENGGCNAILAGEENLAPYVPPGCFPCGEEAAMTACNEETNTTIPPVYYQNPNIFTDDDCKNIAGLDSQSLDSCKDVCNRYAEYDLGCNAFNIDNNPDGKRYCVLRECNQGRKPTGTDSGFVSYSRWQ